MSYAQVVGFPSKTEIGGGGNDGCRLRKSETRFRYFGSQTEAKRLKESPLELLDKEYAQGRIDREGYLRRRSDLTDRSHLADNRV